MHNPLQTPADVTLRPGDGRGANLMEQYKLLTYIYSQCILRHSVVPIYWSKASKSSMIWLDISPDPAIELIDEALNNTIES